MRWIKEGRGRRVLKVLGWSLLKGAELAFGEGSERLDSGLREALRYAQVEVEPPQAPLLLPWQISLGGGRTFESVPRQGRVFSLSVERNLSWVWQGEIQINRYEFLEAEGFKQGQRFFKKGDKGRPFWSVLGVGKIVPWRGFLSLLGRSPFAVSLALRGGGGQISGGGILQGGVQWIFHGGEGWSVFLGGVQEGRVGVFGERVFFLPLRWEMGLAFAF